MSHASTPDPLEKSTTVKSRLIWCRRFRAKSGTADQVAWPLGMDLYLPQPWIEDERYAELRDEVGLPEEADFRTKPEIALELIERARSATVPHACVGAALAMAMTASCVPNSVRGRNRTSSA